MTVNELSKTDESVSPCQLIKRHHDHDSQSYGALSWSLMAAM